MTSTLPLLVPVAIEALVVNDADRRATAWSMISRQFSGVSTHRPVEAPVFVRGGDRPRLGITVNWILPDGLTHARQHDAAGHRLLYPFIPDRWLVVRRRHGDSSAPRAWMIDSDFVGSKPGVGQQSPPAGTSAYPAANEIVHLGRSRPLDEWAAETQPPSLTAVGREDIDGRLGAFDPAWAANVANVGNILAFHDDLYDLADDEAAVFSFAVVGWYSNPDAADPLVNQSRLGRVLKTASDDRGERAMTVDEWRVVLASLGWSVGDEHDLLEAQRSATIDPGGATALIATHTVCHGSVHHVNWTGRNLGAAQPFTASDDSAFAGTAIRSRAGWKNPAQGKPNTTGDFPDVTNGMSVDDVNLVRDHDRLSALGADELPPAGRSPYPQIAIGTSYTDAVAALFEYLLGREEGGANPSDLSTLFQALEHDLLASYNTPGGPAEIARSLHQDGFAAHEGTTWWEVVVRRPDDSPNSSEQTLNGSELLRSLDAVAPTVGLEGQLAALNDAQHQLDVAASKLDAAHRELYALWWKSERLAATAAGVDGATHDSVVERLAEWFDDEVVPRRAGLVASEEAVAGIRRVLDADLVGAGRDALASLLPDDPDAYLELVRQAGPRFFSPLDPVVVISGARASRKHGGDGRFSEDDTLLVRFGRSDAAARGQTLRHADGRDAPAWPGDLLAAESLAGPELDVFRRAAIDLLQEFSVVDDDVADGGSDLWLEPGTDDVSVAAMTLAAGFHGVRPSPVAVEAWAQPWRPLYLCWEMAWYPTPDVDTNWTFDRAEDYEWNGLSSFDHGTAMTMQGRCLLTTAPTRSLRDSIDALLSRIEDRPADPGESDADRTRRVNKEDRRRRGLESVKNALGSADLLVQSLTGFHDQLIQQDATQYHEPPSTLGLPPDVPRIAPMPYRDGAATSHFYPNRHGHARVRRLWVVDAFGQTFDVINEQGQSHESFVPLRGRGVTTVGLSQRADTQMLQFPPRLAQPSRLRLQFLRTALGPVRGWLLPNHLDSSIMVYEADGRALGDLLPWNGPGDRAVVWRPPADGSGAATPDAIADERVRDVVLSIDAMDTGGFGAFKQALDRSLWSTDPLGRRGDNRAVLVGRPIAILAVEAWIELDGPPLADQRWPLTSTDSDDDTRTTGVTSMTVPVRLGLPESRDDGTLGYFTADGRSGALRFHTILRKLESPSPHVIVSAPESWPRLQVGTLSTPPPMKEEFTLLLDPRGAVHASTGLLPTKSFRLSSSEIDAALARLDARFRVGPILTTADVTMPLPADIGRGWSWLEATGVGFGARSQEIASTEHRGAFGAEPSRIREGWLHLSHVVDHPDDRSPT